MAEPESIQSGPVLLLCRDLMFTSKVTGAARATGVAVRVVREPDKLVDLAGRKLIVDLGQEGALEAAASWKGRTSLQVVGFVSHVDEATIGRAREAGIDRVMSRGGFSASVEDVLRS
jgi:hypothetical protein